jgi:hypothetical protein
VLVSGHIQDYPSTWSRVFRGNRILPKVTKNLFVGCEVSTAVTMKNTVPPKRRFTQDLYCATSQKTVFFQNIFVTYRIQGIICVHNFPPMDHIPSHFNPVHSLNQIFQFNCNYQLPYDNLRSLEYLVHLEFCT